MEDAVRTDTDAAPIAHTFHEGREFFSQFPVRFREDLDTSVRILLLLVKDRYGFHQTLDLLGLPHGAIVQGAPQRPDGNEHDDAQGQSGCDRDNG